MVYCGAGIDHVLAEKKDKVAKDCEIVLRPDIEVPPPIEIPPAAHGGSRMSRPLASGARAGRCPGRPEEQRR